MAAGTAAPAPFNTRTSAVAAGISIAIGAMTTSASGAPPDSRFEAIIEAWRPA
jgi:hypothetical protein